MATVNIRRDVDDKFYRYKMPVLQTKIEGKGNGIKTVVPNMSDVARSLQRPPTYPTKFFGCELGAQTSFDEKADRYIVNGAHDATRLRELLDTFIDKFVLCASCKNPETDLVITKNEMIIRDCKACGQRSNVDMRHKLTVFILKNPPKVKKAKKSKDTKEGADAENGGATPPGDEAEDVDSDDELTKRIKSQAAELVASPVSASKEDDWVVDTSADAVKARVNALAGNLQSGLTVNGDDDSDDDANSPYKQLGTWLEANRGAWNEASRRKGSAVEIYKRIQELGIEKKHKTLQVLAQALFSENIVVEIPDYAPIFAKLTTSERHQKSLLGGIERFVGVTHPDLIPSIPKILMAFYQADALEEDVLKQWGTHVSKKYVDKDVSKKVRKASEPFLKWLEEADDEESEED